MAPTVAQATWPGKPGLVAYETLDGINTIHRDGSHHRLIVRGNSLYKFDVSKSGREIAYSNGDLWRIRPDGTHRRQILTASSVGTVIQSPAWAPSGRRLVFTAEIDPSDPDSNTPSRFVLYTVHRDGSHLRMLAPGLEAVWSSSGRHIRFAEQDGDIAQIQPDGSHYKVLAHHDGYTFGLDMSPDGSRLLYETSETDSGEVRTLNVRNGKRTSFYAARLGVLHVVWAPGGKRLAFAWGKARVAASQLRTATVRGRNVRRVLTFVHDDFDWPFAVAWLTR
jgi:Tol biopolymer transport system component